MCGVRVICCNVFYVLSLAIRFVGQLKTGSSFFFFEFLIRDAIYGTIVMDM